jgi:hypothetical protein
LRPNFAPLAFPTTTEAALRRWIRAFTFAGLPAEGGITGRFADFFAAIVGSPFLLNFQHIYYTTEHGH